MRHGSRRFGGHGMAAFALLLVATAMLALVAPIGLRSTSAQDDLGIETRVQILHASPDLGDIEVAINYEEELDEFQYGDVSDFIDIEPGSNRVTITEDRAGFNYAVFDAIYPVPAGNDYTLIISDALVLTGVVDRSPVLDGGARVRVTQAAVDLPAVNVVASGDDVSFATQLNYARSSDYTVVPAGTYDLEVQVADSGTVAVSLPGVALEGNMVYDLVISGAVDSEDHPLEIVPLSDTTIDERSSSTPTA